MVVFDFDFPGGRLSREIAKDIGRADHFPAVLGLGGDQVHRDSELSGERTEEISDGGPGRLAALDVCAVGFQEGEFVRIDVRIRRIPFVGVEDVVYHEFHPFLGRIFARRGVPVAMVDEGGFRGDRHGFAFWL